VAKDVAAMAAGAKPGSEAKNASRDNRINSRGTAGFRAGTKAACSRCRTERSKRPFLKSIVPDFPLVNKSFNLSYAGNDL